jgi:hypothetical protein
MSKAVQLYPHAVSGQVELRLHDFDDPVAGRKVDVFEVGRVAEDEDGAAPDRIDGYDVSATSAWRKLSFRLTADLPTEEIQRILPPTSSVNTDTTMVVLLTCASTKFRHGVRLKHVGDGTWSGTAAIQRDDVKGIVTLRPQLVRSTGIPAAEDLPFATTAGALVAVGEPITLFVDVEPNGGRALLQSTVIIAWEDFANSEHAWRREHTDDVFHLEPFGGDPRLYLNSRYAQLREIMEYDAKRGPEAVLRDMSASMIAQPVLTQLTTVAIFSLELDEDSGSVQIPTGWRGDLLASVLPRLYPEEPSEEDRLQRAARELRESDSAASLLSRLGSVVQEVTASYKTIEAAVRTYESTRGREETADD